MNIPNALSSLRILLTIFFVLAILKQRFEAALWLFTIQALSDLFDGFFARLLRRKTDIGAYLDPIADKVMLISSYIILCLYGLVPKWVLAIIVGRDLIVATGFFVLSFMLPLRPSPSLLGKTGTIMQMVTVIYLLFSETRPYLHTFFYVTCLITIASGIEYSLRGLNVILKREASVKSL